MKNFPILFVVFIALHSFTRLHAQCGITASIITTESLCQNSGTITTTVSSGVGPFQYKLYKGGVFDRSSSSNVFNSLYPDSNYVVKVIGALDSCSFPAIVSGNYIKPGNSDYAYTLNHVSNCYNGSNGSINSVMTNGRPPYSYNIKGGPTNINITDTVGNFSGLSAGAYTIEATDSCGSQQTRLETIYNFVWQIDSHKVERIGCSNYRLNSVYLDTVVPNVKYLIKRGVDSLGFGSSLPLTFSNPDSNINSVLICAVDSCGHQQCVPINTFLAWQITGGVANLVSCDSLSISFIIAGDTSTNFQYGYITSTGDTIPISSSSATIYNTNISLFYAIDSCGTMKTAPVTISQRMVHLEGAYINCDSSQLTATAQGNFLGPYSFSLNGITVLSGNTTGTHTFNNLLDGTYTVMITDTCGNYASQIVEVAHDWYSGGHSDIYCTKKFRQSIYIVNRMKRTVKIVKYNSSLTSALDSANYTGPDSLFKGTISPIYIFGSKVFYDTVSNANYKYIVTDACGRKDTVSVTNEAYPAPDSMMASVSSNCPPDTITGKITANYYHNNVILNPVQLRCSKLLTPSINIFPNLCYANISSNPDTCYWNNMDTGTYVVKMTTLNCPEQIFDTVTILEYKQPEADTSFLSYSGTNTICNITVSNGVPSYTYRVKSSIPVGADTITIHTVAPFTIANHYTQLHVAFKDACGNGPHVFVNLPPFPLPLQSITASANLALSHANVNWITLDEKNIHYFEVQRSIDAKSFITIARKQATGNTNGHSIYKIEDDIQAVEHSNEIYYRVIAKDLDDVTAAISNIVSVVPNQTSDNVMIYPSPFTTNFNVLYSASKKAKLKITILDVTGKVVYEQGSITQHGTNDFEIKLLASLNAGFYFVNIHNETLNQKFVRKILKQ